MGLIPVLNTAFGSIALFTCILQLFLSVKRRGDILSLLSAILSLFVFLRYSLIFLCSSPLAIAEYHLTIWRCQLIFTQLVLICMYGMIFFLLKGERKFIFFVNVVIISVLIIVSIIIPDYQLFDSKEVIYLPNLSNADNIPMLGHGFTWWRSITDLTIVLFVFSSLRVLYRKLRSEHRNKIIVMISGSILLFLAGIYDQFVDLGLINSTYMLPFALFSVYLILNFIPYLFLLHEVEQNTLISLQEKKFQSLVNEAHVIVVGLNRMGHVDFVNPYFLELTGYREEDVLGKDWFEDFIPTKESFNVQGAFIEALGSEFHPYYINPILTKSKEERIIKWYNIRSRDIENNITGSLSLGLDITDETKEKVDLITKLKEAQDQIDKLKNH
jgi:PAS domain S-box-containing protein